MSASGHDSDSDEDLSFYHEDFSFAAFGTAAAATYLDPVCASSSASTSSSRHRQSNKLDYYDPAVEPRRYCGTNLKVLRRNGRRNWHWMRASVDRYDADTASIWVCIVTLVGSTYLWTCMCWHAHVLAIVCVVAFVWGWCADVLLDVGAHISPMHLIFVPIMCCGVCLWAWVCVWRYLSMDVNACDHTHLREHMMVETDGVDYPKWRFLWRIQPAYTMDHYQHPHHYHPPHHYHRHCHRPPHPHARPRRYYHHHPQCPCRELQGWQRRNVVRGMKWSAASMYMIHLCHRMHTVDFTSGSLDQRVVSAMLLLANMMPGQDDMISNLMVSIHIVVPARQCMSAHTYARMWHVWFAPEYAEMYALMYAVFAREYGDNLSLLMWVCLCACVSVFVCIIAYA